MGFLSDALGGVGDFLGGAIGIAQSNYSAAKQRHFNRSMDNTRYQRAARDLDKAGLNRIIALGSPGSAGSSSAPTAPGPQFGATGLRSAQASSAKQAVLQSQAQTDLMTEQARLTGANADEAEFKKEIYNLLLPYVKEAGPEILKFLTGGQSGPDWFANFKDKTSKGLGDLADEVKDALTPETSPSEKRHRDANKGRGNLPSRARRR